MVIRLPGGANSGGSGGGGAPTGNAGGSLTGTYPNPTIATIPSGATATTQAATDGSTKVATTAYVDTADALKANLAGPTFTGVVTLPTGTVATTQSATDGSTKLATTAYTDTADALKANLSSPTFSGTPSLPTGTTATTQAASDTSTKLATTAHVHSLADNHFGVRIGLRSYANIYPGSASASNTLASAGDGRFVRIVCAETGNLRDISFPVGVTGGNGTGIVLDTGQANGTHTTSTCLAIGGATAVGSAGTWFTYDPNLAVTAGDTLWIGFKLSSGSAAMAGTTFNTAAMNTLPASFITSSGAGTQSRSPVCTILSANLPTIVTGTVATGNMDVTTYAASPCMIWRFS